VEVGRHSADPAAIIAQGREDPSAHDRRTTDLSNDRARGFQITPRARVAGQAPRPSCPKPSQCVARQNDVDDSPPNRKRICTVALLVVSSASRITTADRHNMKQQLKPAQSPQPRPSAKQKRPPDYDLTLHKKVATTEPTGRSASGYWSVSAEERQHVEAPATPLPLDDASYRTSALPGNEAETGREDVYHRLLRTPTSGPPAADTPSGC